MKHFLCSLMILLFPLYSYSQFFKNLNMKDGLSHSSVMSIYQDTLGRMWFGTREGVNIYDGKQVVSLNPQAMDEQDSEHFIVGNEVKTIVGGKNGDVFFLDGSQLFGYDIQKDKFRKIHNRNVNSLGNSLDKDIWFVANDSLFLHKVDTNESDFVKVMKLEKQTAIFQANDSLLYLGSYSGLFKYNLKTDSVSCVIPDIDANNIFMSSRGVLWVSSRMSGLYSIKPNGEVVKAKHSPDHVVSNQIRQFVEDDKQNIWFGTFDGLQMYNPYTKKYKVFRSGSRLGDLSHSSVFSLYKDRLGVIWVGTYYGGVNYFTPNRYVKNNYSCNVLRDDCLNFPFVGDMIEDNERNIWIATDGGGVNCLNRESQKFTYYTVENSGILHNNVKTISYDKKRDYIYIGTHTGGLSRLDRKTGKIHNYLTNSSVKGPNSIIFHTEFYNDDLYISARNGLWKLSSETGEFELLKTGRYYINFKIDDRGYIWLNTGTDLSVMNLRNLKDYRIVKLDKSIPMNARITNLAQSTDGNMYIATSGSGLFAYNLITHEIQHYTREEHWLLSNYCYNVKESSNNNILVSTDKGLSIFSPFSRTFYSMETHEKEGISAITDGCGILVGSDEVVYVGGVDGMIAFREKDFLSSLDNIPNSEIYFSGLQVNNIHIMAGDDTGILTKSLPFTKELVLSPEQNNIIVDFSNPNYVGMFHKLWYEYRLDGFDNKWISTTQNSLHYTNLPSGSYILKVRLKDDWIKTYKNEVISLPIVILTPWYKTSFMYVLYFVAVMGLIYIVWRFKMSRKLFEIYLENERKEKERIEELNKVKLQFFTNISHEFRTPLTLMVGQLELLMEDRDLSLSFKRKMSRIYKNTIHMRNLITELLDFRKQEQGYLKLAVGEHDMIAFLQDLYDDFKDYAVVHQIKYEYIYPQNEVVKVWFDAVQLQKAIFNLLSNAFKYTKDNGTIVMRLDQKEDCVMINIEDSGCGISKEDIKHIFDRFYQAENGMHSVSVNGTGIGLALTEGVVKLHKGDIHVTSEVGKGSIFTIRLLVGNKHFKADELVPVQNELELKQSIKDKILETKLETEKAFSGSLDYSAGLKEKDFKEGKPHILIVEDDEDIIEMLEEVFHPIYFVHKAGNGQLGFEMAREIHPDIIVSDVKMPVMTGTEMCVKIKNCFEISYIPIVLLTAHSSVEQKLEGFIFGADDYIAKPFNVKLLVARCNNLVNGRKALMKRMKEGESTQVVSENSIMALNVSDQKFVDKIRGIIEANFDNPDFNVDMLACELNMGRSKLYARFKEITSFTPNEFILKLKLEEGKNLLLNAPELNISEISYKLGFSSLRYFSKCFKTLYGVTPQNFRKNMNAQ